MKFISILSIVVLIASCENTNTHNAENVPKELTTGVNQDNSDSNSIKKIKLDYSEINWNYYIEKGHFEQSSPDSSLLIFVRPDFAIFIFGNENMDSERLIDYQITSFKKNGGKWERQEISANILIENLNDNFGDKWRLEDINGDNHKDILLKINQDEEQNNKYICLLQDPKNKTFTKLEWFSNVINPKYDSVTKTLKSSVSNKKIITESSYQWINDTIKLINQ